MSSIRRGKRSEQSGGAVAGAIAPSSSSQVVSETTTRSKAPAAKSTIAAAVAAAARQSAVSSSSSSTLVDTSPTKQASNGQSATKSKLVFGLSSRTNRVKHDEYAEKRGASEQAAIVTSTSNSIGAGTSITASNRSTTETTENVCSQASISSGSKIRASKYGNFYKPQDLVDSSNTNLATRPSRSPIREPSTSSSSGITTSVRSSRSPARSSTSPQRSSTTTTTTTRRSSPVRKRSVESFKQPTTSSSQLNQNVTEIDKNSNLIIEQQQSMKERGDVGETSGNQKTIKGDSSSPDINLKSQAPPQAKKMQFNIPPPPKMSNSSTSKAGGGSVVSYAKSRIYDKPTRQQLLSNPLLEGESLLYSGAIPESILSGFKPPKQVNVSKAREKWEGGEPFAKCKSRQRLAAQANKKLLHGHWSMSSVVATQQMQLQQVMSNSGVQKNDSSVKILTRGSVLERVQQFEKSPSSSGSTSSSSGGTSSSSSGSSSPGSDGGGSTSSSDGHSDDLGPGLMAAVAAATMPETGTATEAGLALQQPMEPAELRPGSPTSKQALYKSRVSSIQTSGTQPQDPLAMIGLSGPKSPQLPQQNASSAISGSTQQRRLSLRRRSSTASNSSIPKFYHPNGKPNTYEIELQKKNIVACFDKFPDRKALITGPTYRRHFHSIALACGLSEYFKEPLYLYVRHQMTKSNLLHNTSTSTAICQHRQSGIGPGMINGTGLALNKLVNETTTQIQPPTARSLVRAASIDNSTMEKIQNQTFITCEQFLVCWRQMIATAFDNSARFVHLLTFGQRNYLMPDDFVPLIQSIIDDHPGLKFLRAAPDFHMRYIQTVIARIYFCINKSWTGKISLAELRRSNLLAVLEVLSQEEDINQITDYFSYEHFYVIYCKFWNLDQDHDLLISKEDLAKHNDAAISSRIIERIFMGIVSKQIQATGMMSYSDFVWFLIAEEDKKHPRSIEYWFRLMDIDGDGYISMYEMEYFYYEQTKRLELMNIEALPFIDSACQILDLVNPKEKNKISLADLKRTKMATIFFDTFINLEKYLEHESREFVSTRDVVQDGVVISDWDRYASEEYESLVTEESSV